MLGRFSGCMADIPRDLWGVCRFADLGSMIPCRSAARLPEHARSVIVLLFPYLVGEFPVRNVARYAVVNDYHQVAGAILQRLVQTLEAAYPGEAFVSFVDNSPLREVAAARLAGLGVVGWNNQLIHPRYGSYVFIGAVVTTLELAPSEATEGPCLECGACLSACPTGALGRGYFDKNRCRSQITQKKGMLTPWEEEQVRAGGLIWGCDLCQDCCPMNQGAAISPLEPFLESPVPVLSRPRLEELMGKKPYGWRGKAVVLRNLDIINKDQE